MEKFSKVLSRQQNMFSHIAWRKKLAKKFERRFGYKRAIALSGELKIGFDVQADSGQEEAIVRRFKKTGQFPVPCLISLS